MKSQLIIGKMTLAAAVAMLTLNSCMRDNLEDCPPPYNVRLLVKTDYETGGYTRAAAEIDWYEGQIDNVSIYVFDDEGSYVDSYVGPAYTMGEDYTVPFNLEAGKSYHFEAWTNNGERYDVSSLPEPGLARRGEMTMKMNIPAGTRTFTENIPHRHQGTLEEVSVVPGETSEKVIVIEPHTYKVNFIIRGLTPYMTENNEYDVTVTDRNELHAFGSKVHIRPSVVNGQEPYFHHRRMDKHGVVPTRVNGVETRAAGEIGASMILLQIPDDTGTFFDLRNITEDESLYSADLIDMIEKVYTQHGMIGTGPNFIYQSLEDLLNTLYEYTIVLEFSSVGISIAINNWGYEGNIVDL
jgi:hypothetical protein